MDRNLFRSRVIYQSPRRRVHICTLIYRLLNFYPCRIFFSSSHISISLAQNSKNRWPVKSIDHNIEGSCIASTCQAFKDDAALSLVSLEYICTSPKTSFKITREKKSEIGGQFFWFHVELWLDGIIPNCCDHGWHSECRRHGVSLFGGEFRFYFLYTIQVRYTLWF